MIRFSDGSVTLASDRNASVTVIRDPITMDQLRSLRRVVAALQKEHGTDRVSLAVVEPAAMVTPSEEVRAEAAAIPRDLPTVLDATVLEGQGFRAAAVRAVMHGITLVTGRRSSRRTFATVEEAVESIVATGRVHLTRAQLLALVDEARRGTAPQVDPAHDQP
jgi:hypothetical protein